MNTILGIIGLIGIITGVLLPEASRSQKLTLLVANIIMLVFSCIDGNVYYIALEIVVVVGSVGPFLPVAESKAGGLTLMTAIVVLAMLISGGLITNKLELIGAIGLILLAIGFAISNPWPMLFGSICIAIFSGYSFYHVREAISGVFALLNVVFFFSCGYACLRRGR